MSAEKAYLEWRHKSKAVGCIFARLLAIRPEEKGQAVESISTTGTPAAIAQRLADRIAVHVADPSISGATLVLPDIGPLDRLALVMISLGKLPGWTVTTSMLQQSRAGALVAMRVVLDIPFGSSTCPSEALVLGPFSEFPPTRLAPVAAFEIYVGEPLPHDPKTGQPTTKANLAHIIIPGLVQSSIDKMWKMSEAARRASLGGQDDTRAKAKVTLVMPQAMAKTLGCEP